MVLLSLIPSVGNIIYAAVGFVIGALVFRNNTKAGNALVTDLQEKIKNLEDKIKSKV